MSEAQLEQLCCRFEKAVARLEKLNLTGVNAAGDADEGSSCSKLFKCYNYKHSLLTLLIIFKNKNACTYTLIFSKICFLLL